MVQQTDVPSLGEHERQKSTRMLHEEEPDYTLGYKVQFNNNMKEPGAGPAKPGVIFDRDGFYAFEPLTSKLHLYIAATINILRLLSGCSKVSLTRLTIVRLLDFLV